jgi:hypothetical protein
MRLRFWENWNKEGKRRKRIAAESLSEISSALAQRDLGPFAEAARLQPAVSHLERLKDQDRTVEVDVLCLEIGDPPSDSYLVGFITKLTGEICAGCGGWGDIDASSRLGYDPNPYGDKTCHACGGTGSGVAEKIYIVLRKTD